MGKLGLALDGVAARMVLRTQEQFLGHHRSLQRSRGASAGGLRRRGGLFCDLEV